MADDASMQPSGSGYMPEDLHLKGFLVAGVLILGSIAFAVLAAFAVTRLGNEDRPPPHIAARVAGVTSPPAIEGSVKLQPNPGQDIRAFDAEKRQMIATYGCVDQCRGFARIPIERAMALMAVDAKETKR